MQTYMISHEKGTLCLTAYTDKILRVTFAKTAEEAGRLDCESYMITAKPAANGCLDVAESEGVCKLTTPQITAVVDMHTLSVAFER